LIERSIRVNVVARVYTAIGALIAACER